MDQSQGSCSSFDEDDHILNTTPGQPRRSPSWMGRIGLTMIVLPLLLLWMGMPSGPRQWKKVSQTVTAVNSGDDGDRRSKPHPHHHKPRGSYNNHNNDYNNGSSAASTSSKNDLPQQPQYHQNDYWNNNNEDYNSSVVEYPFLFSHSSQLESDNRNHPIGIPYQCRGPHYQQFAQRLRTFAARQIQSGRRPPHWGQRELPPNTRLLIWGNSHTRQMGLSLVGQHAHIDKLIVFDANLNKNMARRFDLGQNRSVYVVANSYAAYSHKWKRLLELQISKRLFKMDALIVGTFNTCNAPVQTTFATDMEKLSGQMAGVDCDHVEGPTVVEISQYYAGPMAYVSMFATYRHKDVAVAHEMVMDLQRQQENVTTSKPRMFEYLDARKYIREMGVECGSPNRNSVSDCVNNSTAARYYHRCTGVRGGHADLLAWDMIDWVWQTKEH